MAGLNEKLTAYDCIFYSGQAVTAADTSDTIDFESGALGSIEIVADVETEVTIASGEALKLSILDSDDDVLATVYDSGTVTADATLSAGTILGQWVVPSNQAKAIKFDITTATAGGAGTLNAFANYLAR